MIDILQSALAFIVALGVLITFHEFGHYWVARRCDVKILRFSIGFGKPLYKKVFGPDKTEFVVASLPLGGYVKMLDEREVEVKEAEKPRSFNYKPLWQRFSIVAAGPVFNFIFAAIAYWLIFMLGVTGLKPIIGEVTPGSVASRAGLQQGDEIISVNNDVTPTWATVIDKFVNHTVNADQINLKIKKSNSSIVQTELDLSTVSIDEMAEGKLLETIGLEIIDLKLPAVIGEVIPGGAAEESGLIQYDEIIAVDGVEIDSWEAWVEVIRNNPEKKLEVKILRNNNLINLILIPASVDVEGEVIGQIGAAVFRPDDLFDMYFADETYSVTHAFLKSIEKTWQMSVLTLRVLGKMLTGEASVKNLSGPISIAQYAGESAGIGLIAFLSFMAIVSVSLGVLNLLPVPLLDGGHLMYYLIEFVIGKPVSDATQIWGQQIGLFLLLCLMSIAFYNDISRLLG